MPLKPTGDVAMRSFKYLQGLARGGVWLLSYEWLDRCLTLGDWAPGEPYESRVGGALGGSRPLLSFGDVEEEGTASVCSYRGRARPLSDLPLLCRATAPAA